MTTEEMDHLLEVRMGEVLEEHQLAFDNVESIFLNYSVAYGEAAYRLGFSDGIQIGKEQKFDERKSFLTIEDMTRLIFVYDAVSQLKQLLLGDADEQGEDAIDKIVFILDDETMIPEERAKKLLALD